MSFKPGRFGSERSGEGRASGWLARILSGRASADGMLPSFRRLAMQLEFDLGASDRGRVLMMAPVGSGEDACAASTELALVLGGELGKRVLVIDGAFQSASTSVSLGMQDRPGLADLLRREPCASRYCEVEGAPWMVMPRGRADAVRPIPLASGEIRQIIDEARNSFDYVLLATDSPGDDGRALVFPACADRVLLLAIEGRTLLEDVDSCRRALENCSETRVGLVLTKPRRLLGLL